MWSLTPKASWTRTMPPFAVPSGSWIDNGVCAVTGGDSTSQRDRTSVGDNPELGAGRVSEQGEPTEGRVVRRVHDGAAELGRGLDGGVGVVHRQVDGPVGRDPLRKEVGGIHEPRHGRLALAERRVAEIGGVA